MFNIVDNKIFYSCDDCQTKITAEEDDLGGQCKECILRDEHDYGEYVRNMFYGRR